MREPMDEAVIVGGGLVGSLLAIFLARRGTEVEVCERRIDPREATGSAGRSINLVVTSRGIHALDRLGLREEVIEDLTVAVTGRMIHARDGSLSYQPYGRDDSECNYSVSRGELNRYLITTAEKHGVRFHFDRRLTDADLETGKLRFASDGGDASTEMETPVVIGADGAPSAVRAALVASGGVRESVERLGHDYKELLIPVERAGGLEPHALHIWPRGERMLMALPNLDGSFTVTIYLPRGGPDSFESLENAAEVRRFFDEQFADAVPLLPDLAATFLANPTGSLRTVRCRPWHLEGRALLVGDAAHAIVPFFGQGMNSGFEDCTLLDALLDAHGPGELERVFSKFTDARKPNADAIADMALDNFVEMSERVGDPSFLLRKQVEHRLEQELPREYRSRYSMVMYSRIPYRLALEAGRIQQGILDELCEGLDDAERCDLDRARHLVGEKLTPFLERNAIALDY